MIEKSKNGVNWNKLEFSIVCGHFPLSTLAPSNGSGPVRAQSSRIQLARSLQEEEFRVVCRKAATYYRPVLVSAPNSISRLI